jgi:hypothetical protein
MYEMLLLLATFPENYFTIDCCNTSVEVGYMYEILLLLATFPESSLCIVQFSMGCQNYGWDSGHSRGHQNMASQYA